MQLGFEHLETMAYNLLNSWDSCKLWIAYKQNVYVVFYYYAILPYMASVYEMNGIYIIFEHNKE